MIFTTCEHYWKLHNYY